MATRDDPDELGLIATLYESDDGSLNCEVKLDGKRIHRNLTYQWFEGYIRLPDETGPKLPPQRNIFFSPQDYTCEVVYIGGDRNVQVKSKILKVEKKFRNASGFVPEPPGIVSEEPEEFDDPGSSLQAGVGNGRFVPELPDIVSEEPEEIDAPGSSLQAGGCYVSDEVTEDLAWIGHQKLRVQFMNTIPHHWRKEDDSPTSTDDILSWANEWSRKGDGIIPCFVEARQNEVAEIRISFNRDRKSQSLRGKLALTVSANSPTMHLDLRSDTHGSLYHKQLVMHQFGTVLGLGHEHRRPVFRKYIDPYINFSKMEGDIGSTGYFHDWFKPDKSEFGPYTAYDPDSIMHFWFNKKWLKYGYSDKNKVIRDGENGILSREVVKVLLGVHKRHETLANGPSQMDIYRLKHVYSVPTETQVKVLKRMREVNPSDNSRVRTIERILQCRKPSDIKLILDQNGLKDEFKRGVELMKNYEVYEEALRKEGIGLPLKYLRMFFFGIPRSGKSTMRRRLMREITNIDQCPDISPSTGVAESFPVLIRDVINETATISELEAAGLGWKSFRNSDGYLFRLFYSIITKAMGNLPRSPYDFVRVEDVQPTEGSASESSSSLALTNTVVKVSDGVHFQSGTQQVHAFAGVSAVDEDRIMRVIDDLAKTLQSESPRDLCNLLILINMMDVGGQPDYLDMLPILTVGPSLYLFFLRLDQMLKKRYQVRFVDDQGKEIKLGRGRQTYSAEEVLYQCIASINCFGCHASTHGQIDATAEQESIPSCRILLMGTHKDIIDDHPEKRSDVDKLKESLSTVLRKTQLYKSGVLREDSDGEIMFEVDNRRGSEESEMADIRMKILEIIKSKRYASVKVPPSWLMFHSVLHKLEKSVVSLDECKMIADKLSMTTPVTEALKYFHYNVGSLLYYDKLIPSLEKTVICKPQEIFNCLTNLIVKKLARDNENADIATVNEFHSKGLFSLSDIQDNTECQENSSLKLYQLIDLLKELNLLVEVKQSVSDQEKRFVIPAILEYASEEELTLCGITSLLIQFEDGFVPFGLFCTTIAELIAQSQDDNFNWTLLCDLRDPVRKNKVKFRIETGFTATLISRPENYVIQVVEDERIDKKHSLQDICCQVRLAFVKTLKQAIIRMTHSPYMQVSNTFHLAFTCPVREDHNDHTMIVTAENSGFAKCLLTNDCFPLKTEYLRWFYQASDDALAVYSSVDDNSFQDIVEFLKAGDECWWHYLEDNEERARFLVEGAFTVTLIFKQLQVYLKREKRSRKYMYFTVDVNKDPTTHSNLLLEQVCAKVQMKIKEKCQKFELAFKCTCQAVNCSMHFMEIDDSISPPTAKCQLTGSNQKLKEAHLSWFAPDDADDALALYSSVDEESFQDIIVEYLKSGDDSWWHYLEENEERAKFLAERAFTVTLLFKQLQVYLKREKQSIKYMYFTVDVNKDPTTHSKLLINQARANVREKIKERCQNLELAFKCTCEATTESVHFMVIDDSISPTTAKCQLTSADQTLKESHLSWFVPSFKQFNKKNQGVLLDFGEDLIFLDRIKGKCIIDNGIELDGNKEKDCITIDTNKATVSERHLLDESEEILEKSGLFENRDTEIRTHTWTYNSLEMTIDEESDKKGKKVTLGGKLAPYIMVMSSGGSIGELSVSRETYEEHTVTKSQSQSKGRAVTYSVLVRPKMTVEAMLVKKTKTCRCKVNGIIIHFNPNTKLKCVVQGSSKQKTVNVRLRDIIDPNSKIKHEDLHSSNQIEMKISAANYEWKNTSATVDECVNDLT